MLTLLKITVFKLNEYMQDSSNHWIKIKCLRWIFIRALCPRLLCSCAAVHSEQVGGGLDISGSSGTDDGSGQLEYGLRQRQEPSRYPAKAGEMIPVNVQFDDMRLRLYSSHLYSCVFSFCCFSVFQLTSGCTGSWRAMCPFSTSPGLPIPWSINNTSLWSILLRWAAAVFLLITIIE